MKIHIASFGNISADIGKIVDLRRELYIAIGINDVNSYDIFPNWNLKKIKFSHVKLTGAYGKFTLNSYYICTYPAKL